MNKAKVFNIAAGIAEYILIAGLLISVVESTGLIMDFALEVREQRASAKMFNNAPGFAELVWHDPIRGIIHSAATTPRLVLYLLLTIAFSGIIGAQFVSRRRFRLLLYTGLTMAFTMFYCIVFNRVIDGHSIERVLRLVR